MGLAVIQACSESPCSSAVGYLMSRFVDDVPQPQTWCGEHVASRAHSSQQQTKKTLKKVSSSVLPGLQ